MAIYYYVFIWSIITGCVFILNNKNFSKRLFLIINIIPIILITGFRSINNGRDTYMYVTIYNTIKDTDWNLIFDVIPRIDKGYLLLNKLISLLDLDYTGFFLIISFITYTGIALFFYKYSTNIWLTLYLFITNLYIFDPFNIVRQMLALSIILISFDLLLKRNYKIFAIIVIFASFIHLSAILFLLLLFLKFNSDNISKSLNRMIMLWCMISIVIVVLVFLFKPLLSLLDTYSYILQSYASADAIKFGFIRNCIYAILPSLLMLYGLKNNIYNKMELHWVFILLNASFLFLVINILTYTVTSMFSRLAIYFQIFICLSIPLGLKCFGKYTQVFINIIIIFLWGIYFYYYLNMQYKDDLIQEYILSI